VKVAREHVLAFGIRLGLGETILNHAYPLEENGAKAREELFA
jgi:hypothetical protein